MNQGSWIKLMSFGFVRDSSVEAALAAYAKIPSSNPVLQATKIVSSIATEVA